MHWAALFMKHGKRLLLLILLASFSASFTMAQQRSKRYRSRDHSLALFTDSVTASAAEYMLHLEILYQKIDSIRNESRLRPEVLATGQKLKANDSILHFVSQNLSQYNHTLNLRNLQMFKILLEDAQKSLKNCNKNLKVADTRLITLRNEIRLVRRDSMLRHLVRDSVSRKKFLPQLKDLRSHWRLTDSLVRHSAATVSNFKTHASASTITCAQLLGRVEDHLSTAASKIFAREMPYLWQEPSPALQPASEGFRHAFGEEQKALNFYFKDSSANRLLRWITGILFFWWVYANLRTLKRLGKTHVLPHYNITYLPTQSLAAAFIVTLSLAPIFDLQAPAAYVQFVQFLLLISLTFLYAKQWPRKLLYHWLGTILLFILFSLTHHILVPTLWQRLWILLLNGTAAILALSFMKILPAGLQLRRFVKSAAVLQVGMNILAIICNVYGRMSLVQLLGITAIFAFTQAMALSALVKIAIEALLLQINTSRLKRSFESTFEFTTIVHHFKRPLLFVVVLMWLVVFTTNLNLYDSLFEGSIGLLHAPRSVGNISFNLGSILLFLLIIWLAHFLQRYLAYFLGDVGDDESEGLAHRSKLLMTRLILLGAGYLLAVAASGLPVDRITIVLGALGVGIGLGLQNIVNNFVSGIILIFDRPLKVGDAVEVGNHAGRVKEIGLRSSTLATADGADVIIPNGDMLSQHIINWTHSNDYKRIDMLVTLNTTTDKEAIIASIKEIIRSAERVLKKREPVVLFDSIKDKELKLKVYFWCDDVYKAEQTESEVLYSLYSEFKAKGITIS